MKIKRRDVSLTICNIWLMPLTTYTIQKSIGVEHNEKEFIWWVAIPILFIITMIAMFKIEK